IIIEDNSNFIYTSLLFYNKYPPKKFIETAKRNDKKGLLMAESWGKYEVRNIDWEKDTLMPNVLLITNEQNWPKDMPILKQLYYPTRQIVLSVNDQISQYPKTEFAWIIVDSNVVRKEKK
ncbi:MAG TPA: hypothetical protein VK338_01175, partial [Candidatus Nitrosocosmicus sp.]|nr:hypothetical protein [Candidatus Nitrosocosmicus sp.]